MQIGNTALDQVAASAIVPALSACGFDAKRVDKHNRGGLLKSEIIDFIKAADLIVADLTNERPNCYLEIGYAMGSKNLENLILTVREDHFPDSPNHRPSGPKVHFDLAGYDILRWNQDELDAFRVELEKRIRRRLDIVDQKSAESSANRQSSYWHLVQRDIADEGMRKTDRSAFMEVTFAPASRVERFTLQQLNKAAQSAQILTFGWPIAPYFQADQFRPRPNSYGISAEISPESGGSYDYWALRTNGEFYWRGSLFEDERRPGEIFFDTRIVRVTEAIIYCRRLYKNLEFSPEHVIQVHIRHYGLQGRKLGAADPHRFLSPRPASSNEEQSESDFTVRLDAIETELVELVKQVLAPLFPYLISSNSAMLCTNRLLRNL